MTPILIPQPVAPQPTRTETDSVTQPTQDDSREGTIHFPDSFFRISVGVEGNLLEETSFGQPIFPLQMEVMGMGHITRNYGLGLRGQLGLLIFGGFARPGDGSYTPPNRHNVDGRLFLRFQIEESLAAFTSYPTQNSEQDFLRFVTGGIALESGVRGAFIQRQDLEWFYEEDGVRYEDDSSFNDLFSFIVGAELYYGLQYPFGGIQAFLRLHYTMPIEAEMDTGDWIRRYSDTSYEIWSGSLNFSLGGWELFAGVRFLLDLAL